MIGRITPAGTITEFPTPLAGSGDLEQIARGPDGNLWFTEFTGKVGRITPAGVVTEFPLSSPASRPRSTFSCATATSSRAASNRSSLESTGSSGGRRVGEASGPR